MGRSYTFECDQCGFLASVSGGEDRGAHCFTTTCECLSCRLLFDAVTHVRLPGRLVLPGSDPGYRRLSREAAKVVLPGHVTTSGRVLRPARSMVGRLLPGSSSKRWVEMKLSCPKSPRHKIRPWKHPGACPRCGVFLSKTTAPRLIWE